MVDEDIDVATRGIALERRRDKAREIIEALAHVGCLSVELKFDARPHFLRAG